jgi:hypothetical protein
MLVVIYSPQFNLPARIGERHKHVRIQALVTQTRIEGLDKAVIHGFSGPDEVELHMVCIRPSVQRFRLELASVVHLDDLGITVSTGGTLQRCHDLFAVERSIRLNIGLKRLKISTTVSIRKRLPSIRLSSMKSIDQRC